LLRAADGGWREAFLPCAVHVFVCSLFVTECRSTLLFAASGCELPVEILGVGV
jgi:hypothetical protein